MKPTSPGVSSVTSSILGVKTPIFSMSYTASVPIILMRMPFFILPSMMRTSTTTPR